MTIQNEQQKGEALRRLSELQKAADGTNPEIQDLQEQIDILEIEKKDREQKLTELKGRVKELKTQIANDSKGTKKEILELRNAISDYLLQSEIAKVA
jgi:predicted  nucleic acid-binding Zn-ribbon protein